MSTYKELIYMVQGEVKQISDDSILNENHIAFLLNKYRTYLLKQKYNNKAQEIPISNYQTICADLKEVPMMAGCPANSCVSKDSGPFMRSTKKVPYPLTFSDTKMSATACKSNHTYTILVENMTDSAKAYIEDVLGLSSEDGHIYTTTCKEDAEDMIRLLEAAATKAGEDWEVSIEDGSPEEDCSEEAARLMGSYSNVSVVSKDRFNYTGYNKFLKNVVYGTIGPDAYVYLRSGADITSFTRVFVSGIFEDPQEAYKASSCDKSNCGEGDENCDEWENTFPLEDALQSTLISMVVRDILGAAYRPKDPQNDAQDNLASVQSFIRQNMKDRYIKDTTETGND